MWKANLAFCLTLLSVKASSLQQQQQQQQQQPLQISPHTAPDLSQVAVSCFDYEFPRIICINRYGSNIKGPFERKVRNVLGNSDTYPSTLMPEETGFHHVTNASFLIWDRVAGKEILGPAPVIDFMFILEDCSHEGPVYSYATDELYFSRLQNSYLPQLVVDLKVDPPTLSEKLADPPIYAGAGSRYRNGIIYYATISGNESLGGHRYYPGIYALDVKTGKSWTLANSYYGYYFNGVDDLDIDEDGRIWFTDNDYGRPCHVNTRAPQINTGTYVFDPKTGSIRMVENSLDEPNGIAFSPDYKTLYLTDTGAGSAIIDPKIDPAPSIAYNTTEQRIIYAYDVDKSSSRLTNKSAVHFTFDYVPDGIKVSQEGYIITAAGHGIDVLSKDGILLVRVQTNFTVINIAWTGKHSDDLWAVGKGGVARVRWALRGPIHT